MIFFKIQTNICFVIILASATPEKIFLIKKELMKDLRPIWAPYLNGQSLFLDVILKTFCSPSVMKIFYVFQISRTKRSFRVQFLYSLLWPLNAFLWWHIDKNIILSTFPFDMLFKIFPLFQLFKIKDFLFWSLQIHNNVTYKRGVILYWFTTLGYLFLLL